MNPLDGSFRGKHNKTISSGHRDQEGKTGRVPTPEIGKEHMPRYKRTSTPVFGCPQSLRRVGSALLSMPRCRCTASRFRCLISEIESHFSNCHYCVIWHQEHLSQFG